MIGKITAVAGLIAVLGFIPLNIEGSTGLDQLHKDLQDLHQDWEQQRCEEQTGNISGCAYERGQQDSREFFDSLINADD
jgi:hypothetical protein